jgi:hypothetical protein
MQYTVTKWTDKERLLHTQKDESVYPVFSGLMMPVVVDKRELPRI